MVENESEAQSARRACVRVTRPQRIAACHNGPLEELGLLGQDLLLQVADRAVLRVELLLKLALRRHRGGLVG